MNTTKRILALLLVLVLCLSAMPLSASAEKIDGWQYDFYLLVGPNNEFYCIGYLVEINGEAYILSDYKIEEDVATFIDGKRYPLTYFCESRFIYLYQASEGSLPLEAAHALHHPSIGDRMYAQFARVEQEKRVFLSSNFEVKESLKVGIYSLQSVDATFEAAPESIDAFFVGGLFLDNGDFGGLYFELDVDGLGPTSLLVVADEAEVEKARGEASAQPTQTPTQTPAPSSETTSDETETQKAGNASLDPTNPSGKQDEPFNWTKLALCVLGVLVVVGAAVALVLFLKKKKADKAPDPPLVTEPQPQPRPNTPAPEPLDPISWQEVDPFADRPNITGPGIAPKLPFLVFRSGPLAGRQYLLTDTIKLGRGPGNHISFPDNTPGVSREHLTMTYKDGVIKVYDSSSRGTYYRHTGDGEYHKLPSKTPATLQAGDHVYLGSKDCEFQIVMK